MRRPILIVIFRIVDRPEWPLTNNEAERALRHWAILRSITQGTRWAQGNSGFDCQRYGNLPSTQSFFSSKYQRRDPGSAPRAGGS